MEEVGVNSIKKFGDNLLDLADMAGDVWDDKKISFSDAGHLARLVSIAPGIGSSALLLGAELSDLTKDEELELRSYFSDKLKQLNADNESDQIEKVAGLLIDTALKVSQSISEYQKLEL